jgi:hypothetical protein
MHGQTKRPQAENLGPLWSCPTGAGGQERSGTPIKLKIRVLIRESACPNLDTGIASPRRLRFDGPCPEIPTSVKSTPGKWHGACYIPPDPIRVILLSWRMTTLGF